MVCIYLSLSLSLRLFFHCHPPHLNLSRQTLLPVPAKLDVNSVEWHRRNNHKEVERRRREAINGGIEELAKIVPDCQKSKGSILARAVQYIQELRNSDAENAEKWELEKLLTDQAMSDLSRQVQELKEDNQRLQERLISYELGQSPMPSQMNQPKNHQETWLVEDEKSVEPLGISPIIESEENEALDTTTKVNGENDVEQPKTVLSVGELITGQKPCLGKTEHAQETLSPEQ